jgi:hypothetical protein
VIGCRWLEAVSLLMMFMNRTAEPGVSVCLRDRRVMVCRTVRLFKNS